MSRFVAEIDVMPLDGLLDPQGRTVEQALRKLGIEGVEDVRVGKHIRLVIDAASEDEARRHIETALQKLLHNPVVEQYHYTLHAL